MAKAATYENLSPAQLAELRDTPDLPIKLFSRVRDQSSAKTYQRIKAGHLTAWKDGGLTRIAETPNADMRCVRKPFVAGINPAMKRSQPAEAQAD